MTKSEDDFQASVVVLQEALRMYDSGERDAYRLIATELRKLLCDRDPLLPRVRPGLKLHKLHWTQVLEGCPSLAEGLEVMMPGQLTVSRDGTYDFELVFAQPTALVGPTEWVGQPFLSPSITVWELIKSVADKEGAHSDRDYNETLVRAKMVKYVRDDSHIPAVVALGRYLTKWLRDSGAVAA
jgi:hypothetical protein